VFIEHPPKNSMASFSFTSTVLDEGITFIFGSWIRVTNGLGDFNSHLADSRKPEASTTTRRSDLDEFIENLNEFLLPDIVGQIEEMSIFDATSIRAAPELVGSDSNRSKAPSHSESLSDLEEDIDRLLKLEDVGATACRGAPIVNNYSDSNEEYSLTSTTPSSSRGGLEDEGATTCQEAPVLDNHSQLDDHTESFSGSHLGLTITSMPQGCFVYWKGLEPSELLEYDSCLVAFTQKLPFEEGKPLSTILEEGEGSTELVEYSHTAENSPDRQVYMASLHNVNDDEPGSEYDAELLADVYVDEHTADAPQDKNEEHRRIWWLKNTKRA
jgi:hypothetical protein